MENDSLPFDEVGEWAEGKYQHVWHFSKMFATSMKNKWECRIFIGLFAGSGFSKIKDSDRIVKNASLLAMDMPDPFNKYIFCERQHNYAEALESRIKRFHPKIDMQIIEGDLNAKTEEICAAIPKPSKSRRVLSFCFVDPYKLGNLKFTTISKLADFYVDFLVLIPSYMDAHRNVGNCMRPQDNTLDEFLGRSDWRDNWAEARKTSRYRFGKFVAMEFGCSMKNLNYEFDGLNDMVVVKRLENNLPLYHLAFFSRNQLGMKFWREARKVSDDQLSFL